MLNQIRGMFDMSSMHQSRAIFFRFEDVHANIPSIHFEVVSFPAIRVSSSSTACLTYIYELVHLGLQITVYRWSKQTYRIEG